jgi:hypothetical protein
MCYFMIYSKLVFWWDYVINNRVVIQLHGRITTMGPLLVYHLFWGFLILFLILNDDKNNQKEVILLQGRLLHVGAKLRMQFNKLLHMRL